MEPTATHYPELAKKTIAHKLSPCSYGGENASRRRKLGLYKQPYRYKAGTDTRSRNYVSSIRSF
jgi:hypothetical protein